MGVAKPEESRSQRRGGPGREGVGLDEWAWPSKGERVPETGGPAGKGVGFRRSGRGSREQGRRKRVPEGKWGGVGEVGGPGRAVRRCESGRGKWAGKDRAEKETDGRMDKGGARR